jgi:hypothetical protein
MDPGPPFIGRRLRPEAGATGLAPPLLPVAPRQAELRRRVRDLLGPRLCKRLGVPQTTRARRLALHQAFCPHPNVLSANLEGDSVLLDVRTARLFRLNSVGALIWNRLRAGCSLGAAHAALRRRFDVCAEVAWADLVAFVSGLRRERLLREVAPYARAPRLGPRAGGGARGTTAFRENATASQGRKAPQAARAHRGPPPGSAPGVFGLHAVGVEKDGCGFLVAAASTFDKSPALRALLRAGYRPVSGTTALLRQARAGLELVRVPQTHRSSSKSAGPRIPKPTGPAKGKCLPTSGSVPRQVLGSALRARAGVRGASGPYGPSFLLFPQAVDWPDSSLEPLRRSHALEDLLPLTLVWRKRPLAAREFRLLARLVRTTACYRLLCGEKVSALPALFDVLLKNWKASHEETKRNNRLNRTE